MWRRNSFRHPLKSMNVTGNSSLRKLKNANENLNVGDKPELKISNKTCFSINKEEQPKPNFNAINKNFEIVKVDSFSIVKSC